MVPITVVSDLTSQDIRTLDTASDWAIANLGAIMKKNVPFKNAALVKVITQCALPGATC